MKKKLRISLCLIAIILSLKSFGQNIISGRVYSTDSLKIQQVSVVLTDKKKSNIIAYTYTNFDGFYRLKVKKLGKFSLRFSHIGYSSKSIDFEVIGNESKKNINIFLEEKKMNLDAVIIQHKRSISIKKDTISFKTKYFVDGTEQNVEQLLKKIPGLQVERDGTIKVGTQEVEKLMVDDDDLFGKGYKILSKNMPAYPIEEVEVLKKYSHNPLLKGIEESDKVAINLKLDDKSKRIWFGNIEVSLGNDKFYKVKGNLMNFGKKNKYYFLTNLNNIGYNAKGDISQLIRPFRFNEPGSVGDNQNVNSLLSLSVTQPNFQQGETNFNNDKLLSLNAIFNPSEKLKIKTLGFFNWDEKSFFRNSNEVLDVNGKRFTNNEDFDLRSKNRIAFGKLDFIYKISKTKTLEVITKYNNGNFEDGSNLVFNSNSTLANLKHKNTLFDQKIGYTNKFKNKKVLLLTGRFINEKAPQNYQLNKFFYRDLFPNNSNANNLSQFSENQMQFVGINAHLLDRKDKGHLLELQLGNEYRKDKLKTTFSLLEDKMVIGQPDDYQNLAKYQVNDLYLKSKYRLTLKTFGITGQLNFHQLFNKLENNNSTSSNQNPFFINPSIRFDWQINASNKITSFYSYSTTNANILDLYKNFVLTEFRSFSKGTGNFSQLDASNLIFTYNLGKMIDIFSANAIILYSKNHDFYSTNTFIKQNFTQTEKILIKDREFISINSNLNYYFKLISSNLKLNLGYTQIEFKNIVNGSNLRKVRSKNYNYGLSWRSVFKGIFNYNIGIKWSTTEIQTPIKYSFTNNVSFIDLYFVFNKNFDLKLKSECYYFGSLKTDNIYYFVDLYAGYKLIEGKLTLGITGKNLLNTKRFWNFSVSDIGTSTTEYRLLPRFVLLSIEYRF